MKTDYRRILVFAMAAILITTAVPCIAAEEDDDNIWSEDMPQWEHGRFELTEERIAHIMNRLEETDPDKAEELKQLQEKDPQAFEDELRKTMQERFAKKHKELKEERPWRPEEKHGRFGPDSMPMPHNTPMRWKHEKYLKWLNENYAEEAEKLAKMREMDPNVYWKHLGSSFKKYGRIAEAARESQELAEVLKEDLVLKQQRDELLEEIKTADEDERKELIEELKKIIDRRFDLIVKRKQIEYEKLTEKLEKLKKEVEQREAKVEKWQNAEFKSQSVKSRLEELLGESDTFKW